MIWSINFQEVALAVDKGILTLHKGALLCCDTNSLKLAKLHLEEGRNERERVSVNDSWSSSLNLVNLLAKSYKPCFKEQQPIMQAYILARRW